MINEYKIIIFNTPLMDMRKIAEMDQGGWELISVVNTNEGFVGYFKKPIDHKTIAINKMIDKYLKEINFFKE